MKQQTARAQDLMSLKKNGICALCLVDDCSSLLIRSKENKRKKINVRVLWRNGPREKWGGVRSIPQHLQSCDNVSAIQSPCYCRRDCICGLVWTWSKCRGIGDAQRSGFRSGVTKNCTEKKGN